jgi:hypothetical protein
VRYEPDHDVLIKWAVNEADVHNAKVIWLETWGRGRTKNCYSIRVIARFGSPSLMKLRRKSRPTRRRSWNRIALTELDSNAVD